MSDIEFLAIKEFDGKLVRDEGRTTAAGTLATLTASGGKDMYLASAKVVFAIEGVNQVAFLDTVELQANGVVIETALSSMLTTTGQAGADSVFSYEFKNIGIKVATTQVIRLQVTVQDADITIEGFIECFEETTGDTPQIPTI